MVHTWSTSDSHGHGFFVAPLAAVMVYLRRHGLSALPWRSDLRALGLLALLVVLGVLGSLLGLPALQQGSAVALIGGIVWLLIGSPVAGAIMFPLAFLLFMVPLGQHLVPPLVEFTASFTIRALRVTGIPVYIEGAMLWTPTGKFSVVEGCSGIRYLSASVCSGSLFAYTMYKSPWRRGAFVLLSIGFPIIANGLRAYGIVMIAHLTDGKWATGVDHLLYGWVFFGLVMFAMFWLGSFWFEAEEPAPSTPPPRASASTGRDGSLRRAAIALLAAVGVMMAGASWLENIRVDASTEAGLVLRLPETGAYWQRSLPFTEWMPTLIHAKLARQHTYSRHGIPVTLSVALYGGVVHDAPSSNAWNVLVGPPPSRWVESERRIRPLVIGTEQLDVVESVVRHDLEQLLVWHWYWAPGRRFSSPWRLRLHLAWARLTGKSTAHAAVTLVTSRAAGSRDALSDYLDDLLKRIEDGLSASLMRVGIANVQAP